MLRVNIVVKQPDLPWIAGRLARELVDRLPAFGLDAQINRTDLADLDYHQIVYGRPPTERAHVPQVGLFTHGEERARSLAPFYDGHIALNPRIAGILEDAGAPNPVVIEQAVDQQFLGEGAPVFGVAGSTKGDGRKGEALVAQMVRHGYKVRAWGSGWPCEIVANQIQHLPAFYRGLDYYVVTSSDEGGCTPIIEAMAMKIPVISPRIGFAISRPVIAYNAGDWESLHRILRDLTEHRTYEDWAADHARYFLRMMA